MTGLLVRCNCNNHYYYTSLVQVQQTAQIVGYCYKKYECRSVASVSEMHACRCKFNGHDWWLGATVKDMADGMAQIKYTWMFIK